MTQLVLVRSLLATLVSASVSILFIAPPLRAADDLSLLTDEFDSATTITNWRRIHQIEGWGNNVLEAFDINTSRPGRMMMMPYSSSWYEEFRGELTFKFVAGDFVITTDVEPTSRSGAGPPQGEYSLSGIMVRTPRSMTNVAQWTPGGQNYVFLSLGAASNPGQFQFEVKTTSNSMSTLFISDGASRAAIQVARLGAHLIMLRRNQGSSWQVHRRYFRPDMPTTLQAGLTVYTDWPLCQSVGFQNQNTRVLTNGAPLSGGGIVAGARPELIASFDYVRYQRPQIPANLTGANFSNPAAVTDAQLLSFLGANANTPGGSLVAASFHAPSIRNGNFSAEITLETNRSYRIQTAVALSSVWTDVTNFVAADADFLFQQSGATNFQPQFYRLVSP